MKFLPLQPPAPTEFCICVGCRKLVGINDAHKCTITVPPPLATPTTKNIIDVVRELKSQHSQLPEDDYIRDGHTPFDRSLLSAFPSLATALGIAVEALERDNQLACGVQDAGTALVRIGQINANSFHALSRIRSLPLS